MAYEEIYVSYPEKFREVLKYFFSDICTDSSIGMVPYISDMWRVERKYLTYNGGGFIGRTNNKILGRHDGYCEPLTGPVSLLMYKFMNFAMFSPKQRLLWIQYAHDRYDVRAPLNNMMHALYGAHIDKDRGMVGFDVVTTPTGIITGTCTINLGTRSSPNSVMSFASGERIKEGTYMQGTIVLHGIKELDGNNTVHLFNTRALSRELREPVYIDGGDVGLW